MERAKLIVKNFGPLKDIEIEVREMVTFIGAQASGKSTLAKLLSIFEDDEFRENKENSFISELKKYNIQNYINSESFISYSAPVGNLFFNFIYENEKIHKNLISKEIDSELFNFNEDLLSKIDFENIENLNEISKRISKELNLTEKEDLEILNKIFQEKNINLLESIGNKYYNNNLRANEVFKTLRIITGEKIYFNSESIYLSTERTFLHLIASNALSLLNNNVKLPKHLLLLGQEYEKACQTVNEINLNIINKGIKLKRDNNNSYIIDNGIKLDLLESASGIQTIVPILQMIEYSKTFEEYYNLCFVIEEPELNLYPKAQHELIKYLVKNCLEERKNLILTTHSPFILASINNLLLAYDKGQEKPKETNKIIKKESWLNPKHFIAYQLKNGKAYKIMDDKLGQIKENMIDSVSDSFSDEFNKLLDL